MIEIDWKQNYLTNTFECNELRPLYNGGMMKIKTGSFVMELWWQDVKWTLLEFPHLPYHQSVNTWPANVGPVCREDMDCHLPLTTDLILSVQRYEGSDQYRDRGETCQASIHHKYAFKTLWNNTHTHTKLLGGGFSNLQQGTGLLSHTVWCPTKLLNGIYSVLKLWILFFFYRFQCVPQRVWGSFL